MGAGAQAGASVDKPAGGDIKMGRLFTAVGYVTVILALYVWAPHLVSSEGVLPFRPSDEMSELSSSIRNVVDASDKAASMLFTMTLGLLAANGLYLRDRAEKGPRLTWFEKAMLAAFAVSTVICLYMGYLVRLEVLHSANYGTLPMPRVQNLLGLYGLFVACAALFTVLLWYNTLLGRVRRVSNFSRSSSHVGRGTDDKRNGR